LYTVWRFLSSGGAYQDWRINPVKAAELLDSIELQLCDRFIELGIALRIGGSRPGEGSY
jgi:hypothetical protein